MLNSKMIIAGIAAVLLTASCSQQGNVRTQALPTDSLPEVSGIVGGSEVDLEDPIARSTVALYSHPVGVCTGTLISQTLIVTAAHCIAANTEMTVVFDLSMENWNQNNSRPVVAVAMNSKYEKVVQLANTPPANRSKADLQYVEQVGWGDVAIVRFGGSLPQGFVPAKILPNARPLVDGSEITLAGYGRIDGLLPNQKVIGGQNLPLGGTGILRKIEVPIAKSRFKLGEVLIDQSNGGACRGDSGGPAFIKDRTGQHWLFGVISHGEGNRNSSCTVASAATNLITFLPWLEKMAPALMMVDARKAMQGGKFIPLRVTEADAAQFQTRR